MRQHFTATEASRLDVFVVQSIPDASRSFASSLCDQGKVSINGVVTYKTSAKVKAGDIIEIEFDKKLADTIPEISLEILYEDDDCIVIIKPDGVLTHSKGAFNPEATVSSFIRPYTIGMQDNRGGIVHRLDRVTSGVLICAKHEKALEWLQQQFADRKAKKEYIAVVQGVPETLEATIEMPIERNPKKPQTFRVGPNGKKAETYYKVIKHTGDYSLVDLKPVTGRTHQLRVHMQQIGHPIVGDVLYGAQPADRTYLHAHSLTITIPSGKTKTFTAAVPSSFNDRVDSHG
jgi:23S rRNA pseudouridine1911/1915/1917 synthase